jgi:hypothetical protein
LIQVAKPQGPNTSSPEKIPQGEIGRYGLNSGTNGHEHMATGDKLHIPFGKWLALTHRLWRWFYSPTNNNPHQIKEWNVQHYLPAPNCQQTRLAMMYTFIWEEDITPDFKTGLPTSVVSFSNNNVNKLNKGDQLAKGTSLPTDF